MVSGSLCHTGIDLCLHVYHKFTNSPFILHSGTSGIAPVRSGKYVYTESIVSAQQDLKPKSLCVSISLIRSHFNQHVRCNHSCVPNGFDLIVQLCLHQEWDRFSLIQFNGVVQLVGLVWSGSVWFGLRLHYELHVTQRVELFRSRALVWQNSIGLAVLYVLSLSPFFYSSLSPPSLPLRKWCHSGGIWCSDPSVA